MTSPQLVSDLQREGLAPATILTVLTPLKRVFDNAVRRGLLAANPVNGLERHERPRSRHDEMRILNSDEIDALLSAAPAKYRTLLATAVFTGLRSGELLGLHWSDIDFAVGVVHVSRQVDKTGRTSSLKTMNAYRDVVLIPGIARLLREHRMRSRHTAPDEYVFARPDGRPMHADSVRRCGLHAAVRKAGLDRLGKRWLRFHDLRHTYASILIAQGVNVAFVSRQLGHATVSTTLNVYVHLFDRAEHAATVIDRLESRFAKVLASENARPVAPEEPRAAVLAWRAR